MIALKNILIAMVVLSVILPCGHVIKVHNVTDNNPGPDIYACAHNSCECFTANRLPCSNKQIQFISTTAVKLIDATPGFPVGAKSCLPINEHPIKNPTPVVYGVLSSILTIQLLI